MEALFPLVLAISQWLLGTSCACTVEPITEVHENGTYVGAIAPAEEDGSFGVFFANDGSIKIEDRR